VASMPHLVRWNQELSPFGLVVIGPHVQSASEEEAKTKARALGIEFTVFMAGFIKTPADFNGIPHCMLFDQTGKCVYRGKPDGVEKVLRSSVGKALVASLEKPPTSKAVTPLAESLKSGQSPLAVLQRAAPLLKSKDPTTVNEARQLIDRLSAAGQKKFDKAEESKADNPLGAYLLVEPLSTEYRGTPLGAKAAKLLAVLSKDKAVVAELRARPLLETVKKLDRFLEDSAKNNAVTVDDAKFLKAQAPVLQNMRRTLVSMKQSYPNARVTIEALAIGEKYGIQINDKKKA
jgi:hypothetical protein